MGVDHFPLDKSILYSDNHNMRNTHVQQMGKMIMHYFVQKFADRTSRTNYGPSDLTYFILSSRQVYLSKRNFVFNVWFQKKSIPTPWKVIGNSLGEGGLKC